MKDCRWLICPVCGGKTRNQVRADTILINYTLFCPKCKRELLATVDKNDTASNGFIWFHSRMKPYHRR